MRYRGGGFAFVAVTLLVGTLGAVAAGPRTSTFLHINPSATGAPNDDPGDWPTYMANDARSSADVDDQSLGVAKVANLSERWNVTTNGSIAASPIVARGTVYIGSWDGYEYSINASTGAVNWATYIDKSLNPKCKPAALGVTSTATWNRGVLYVGGGGDYWYALNAANGSVLWKVYTGNNSSYYNWGSPLIVHNHAYIGLASYCDKPLIRGALLEVGLTSHRILRTFYTVPTYQTGGGIWSSPMYDVGTNSIFVTTGNGGLRNQSYAPAILSLNATTLALQGYWKIPANQTGVDSDFGATPTLVNGPHHLHLVVVANKNGIVYAFNRLNLSAGPVWWDAIAPGGACPSCGDSDISSAAFAGGTIFLATPKSSLNGTNISGSINALWPSNGTFKWRTPLPHAVLAAVSYDHGVVAVASGSTLVFVDAAKGRPIANFTTQSIIYGPASFAHGCVFVGSTDYRVYALGATGSNCTASSSQGTGHGVHLRGLPESNGAIGLLPPQCLPISAVPRSVTRPR